MHGETADVRGADGPRIRMAAGRHYVDERLVRVAFVEQRLKIRLLGDASIQRGEDAANRRRQMRIEYEADVALRRLREALARLGPVAMARDVVGGEVVRDLGKEQADLPFAPCAAHARLRVRNQMAGIHQT